MLGECGRQGEIANQPPSGLALVRGQPSAPCCLFVPHPIVPCPAGRGKRPGARGRHPPDAGGSSLT